MSNSLTLAYVVIAFGFLLLVAEAFVPSGGALFVLAVTALAVGVTMTFLYSQDPAVGLLTLFGVIVAVPAGVGLWFHYMPRTRLGRPLFLQPPAEDDATVATMPVNLELERLRGRFGRAVTPLRPSGTVEFDGREVDVLTEGLPVEPGNWVKCIDVRAGKVVVRPVAGPATVDFETADFD